MQLNSVKISLDDAEKGVWFPLEDGARIRIAKWGNKKHAAFLADLVKNNKTRIEMKAISDDESNKLLSKQWDFIITGLEGVKDGEKDVVYTPELIRELSLNDEFEELFRKVELISKDEMNFRKQRIKELGENSPAL